MFFDLTSIGRGKESEALIQSRRNTPIAPFTIDPQPIAARAAILEANSATAIAPMAVNRT
jgi:hypothetical protein